MIIRTLRRLPEPIKSPLRKVRPLIERLSPRSRWLANEYLRFGFEQRRQIFLAIARFHHINRPMNGYYMEFGCHAANTVRLAWDNFRHLFDWDFICFDSFEGLPEIRDIDRQEIWSKGKLATAESAFRSMCEAHGIPRDRLVTVRGFYDQTLNAATRLSLLKRAAVVYIDCDLYHSTVPVLEFVRHFLQDGTVIVFDDWNCFRANPQKGERKAWAEFRAKHPQLRFEPFLSTAEQQAFVFVEG
jgi:O-methyltransferase